MEQTNNNLSTRIGALILSLLINAIGNGFTIVSNCGSGIWTAAAVNLSPIFHWSIGLVIFGYAVIAVIINQILIAHFDLKRILGELIYSLLFGYFINFFTIIINDLGFGRLNLFMRIIEVCFGIVLVCSAISLYQRANIFMHSVDDMSNLMRFKLFEGNSIIAQLVSMSIPVIIVLICFFINKRIQSIGIGTLISILCNSFLIKYADKCIFPSLVHNFNKSDNMK